MGISKIEIDFAIPVDVTANEQIDIDAIIGRICRRNTPDGHVHWCSGVGSRPSFSQADQRFMGKPVDPSAPVSGEPTWDDSVLQFETCCRPAHPNERAKP